MRIAFLAGQLTLGGAERQLYLASREMVAAGWDVHVLTFNPGRGDYWEGPLADAGAVVHPVGSNGGRLLRLAHTGSLLRKIDPDVVHSWMLHTNVYAAWGARLAGVSRRIGSERSTETSSRAALGMLYRLQLRGLDALVTNNTAARDMLARSTPGLPVFVVPNAVEVPSPEALEAARRELRRDWQLAPDALVVGAAGVLRPEKNFGALLAAADPLFERYPQFAIVIAGEGPEREALARMAGDRLHSRRVILPGVVAPAGRAAAAFDLLCLPAAAQSREGLPNVVMEALASGVPVVATSVGGVPDLLRDDACGFVVPPGDLASMRDRIDRLLRDAGLRRRMGSAARSMMDQYSPARMAANLLDVYSGAAADHPSSCASASSGL